MVGYNEIVRGLGSIRVDFPLVYKRFTKEKYMLSFFLKSLTSDVGCITYSQFSKLDDVDFIIRNDGIYISYDSKLKKKFASIGIIGKPGISELTDYLNKVRSIKNPYDFKVKGSPYFNAMNDSYKKYYEEHFQTLRSELIEEKYKDEYAKVDSKSKRKSLNRRVKKEVDRLLFEKFKQHLCEQLVSCITYSKANNRKLNKVKGYLDAEKIYYFIADAMTRDKCNKDMEFRLRYVRSYIEHVRKYITDNRTLNNASIGFSYKDKAKYRVDHMISFLEKNSSYRFDRPESEVKQVVKNLEVYDYSFFVDQTPGITREKLGEYYKFGKQSRDIDAGELLARKAQCFLSLNPSKIRQGIDRYAGYIGFVVGDKVILEHFFKNLSSRTIVTDEAIYIINDEDFESITRMGKLDVIQKINSGEIKAKRIYHTGNWEERVNKQLRLKRD